jgi:hypothetical protein
MSASDDANRSSRRDRLQQHIGSPVGQVNSFTLRHYILD